MHTQETKARITAGKLKKHAYTYIHSIHTYVIIRLLTYRAYAGNKSSNHSRQAQKARSDAECSVVAKARHEEALIYLYIQYVYTIIQYVYTVCKAWCNAECSVVAKARHEEALIYLYIQYVYTIIQYVYTIIQYVYTIYSMYIQYVNLGAMPSAVSWLRPVTKKP